MSTRWIPRTILALAALASIATSRVGVEWYLDENQLLPAGVIDQGATIVYPIRVELRGPGPYPSLNGLLTASITLDPRTAPEQTAAVIARVRSTTNPSVLIEEETVFFADDTGRDLTLSFMAWNGCHLDPCSENFELELTRSEVLEPLSFDISGVIRIDAYGDDSDGDGDVIEGTQLILTIGAPQ